MTTTINANTSAGLVYSADTSGIVKLQSNGVATNALAWVNFNGIGTVAIRSSYNVSSITDNGTGYYTVNLTTALADANGCLLVFATPATSYNSSRTYNPNGWIVNASSFSIETYSNSSWEDYANINAAIFGN